MAASMVVVASLVAGSAAFVPKSESQALLDPSAKYPGECPCKNTSLCEIIKTPRFEKELFAFHVAGEYRNFDQWRQYDWSRLTTIAPWEFLDDSAELYCYAKSLGVRVVVPASPTVDVYGGTNETVKESASAFRYYSINQVQISQLVFEFWMLKFAVPIYLFVFYVSCSAFRSFLYIRIYW